MSTAILPVHLRDFDSCNQSGWTDIIALGPLYIQDTEQSWLVVTSPNAKSMPELNSEFEDVSVIDRPRH